MSPPGGTASARLDFHTPLDGIGDDLLDRVEAALVDQRPHLAGFFESVAKLQGDRPSGETRNEALVDGVFHIEPIRRDANLSSVGVFGWNRRVERRLDVGVVENDHRRVATKFQADPLERGRLLRLLVAGPAFEKQWFEGSPAVGGHEMAHEDSSLGPVAEAPRIPRPAA